MITETSAARWRQGRWALIVVLALTWLANGYAQGDETAFSQDRVFLTKLIDIQFYDFAQKQLAQMRSRYPKRQEQIDVLQVELLTKQGQQSKAKQVLEKITPDNPAYAEAQLQLAALSEDREKIAYYEKYIAAKKQISGKAEVQDWLGAVVGYATALADLGEAKKAAEALKLLGRISPDNEQAQRQIEFFTAEMKLNLAASMRDDKEPLANYKALVDEAKTTVSKMIFKPDFFAAQAYGELMHAYVLLAQPDMAKDVLEDAYGFCKPMEQSLKESTGGLALSPVARLLYYRGEMYMEFARQAREKAKQAKDKDAANQLNEDSKEDLVQAASQYALVMQNYDTSRFYRKAASRFNTVQLILKNYYNVNIQPGGGQSQKQKYSLGMDEYRKQRYDRAAQMFLEGAAAAWKGPKVTDCLFMASVCFYKSDKDWEAMAVADMLADRWPEEKVTRDALYNVGRTLLAKATAARDAGKADDASRYSRWSDRFFIRFVELAPTDPKAATVAWRVAESQFARANELRDEVARLQQDGAPVAKVNEKILEMRHTYLNSVPLYQSVADNYGGTEQGTRAYYKIGWAYHMADKHVEAAEAFLNYVKAQDKPIPEKIEAKALAADRLLRAGFPEEAIQHYRDLIAWTGADTAFDPKSPVFQQYREIAMAQIPWAYDHWTEVLKKQIADLEVQRVVAATEAKTEPAAAAGADGGPEPVKLDPEVINKQLAALREKLKEVRAQTIAEFEKYVKGNPDNAEYTPVAMLKLGIMYSEEEQFGRATDALQALQQKYPDTEAGRQAVFSLFRAFVKTGKTEEATKLGEEMRQQIPSYAVGNLNYIANNMVDMDNTFQFGGLDPELALLANQELLRRAEDPKNPDSDKLQTHKERILYRIAVCHYIIGQYDQAVGAVDRLLALNERSPYTWDATMIKGLSQAARENWEGAMATFANVTAYVDKNKMPTMYYWATLESGHCLVQTRDKQQVRRGIGRLKQLTEFINIEDVPEKARPVIERAYYEEAVALALLGEQNEALRATNTYLKKFPDGRYKKEIQNLPPPL